MRLTPIDVLNKRFPRAVRGYTPAAVDDFLREVGGDFEAVVAENARLQDRVEAMEREIETYRAMEETLKRALVLAEKTAGETCDAARREADRVVREAQDRASALAQQAESDLEGLRRQRSRFLRGFRLLLQEHMESLAADQGSSGGAQTGETDGQHAA